MKKKCERCGFEYEENTEGVGIQRCPECHWRQLLGSDGQPDEKVWEEEEKLHETHLPKGVMHHLCYQGRVLVEAIIGPTNCMTYVDNKGQKHTLCEGRHFDLEVWEYWVHPNPLIDYKPDQGVSVILVFEYQIQGATRHEVEVFGQEYPILADWTL